MSSISAKIEQAIHEPESLKNQIQYAKNKALLHFKHQDFDLARVYIGIEFHLEILQDLNLNQPIEKVKLTDTILNKIKAMEMQARNQRSEMDQETDVFFIDQENSL